SGGRYRLDDRSFMMKLRSKPASGTGAVFSRPRRVKAARPLKILTGLVCLMLAGMFGAGCKKTDSAASAVPPVPAATNGEPGAAADAAPPSPRGPGTPGSSPAVPVVIQESANLDATLAQLTSEL